MMQAGNEPVVCEFSPMGSRVRGNDKIIIFGDEDQYRITK